MYIPNIAPCLEWYRKIYIDPHSNKKGSHYLFYINKKSLLFCKYSYLLGKLVIWQRKGVKIRTFLSIGRKSRVKNQGFRVVQFVVVYNTFNVATTDRLRHSYRIGKGITSFGPVPTKTFLQHSTLLSSCLNPPSTIQSNDTPASAQMTESPINTNTKNSGMRVEGRVTHPPKSTPTKCRYVAVMRCDEERWRMMMF